MQLQLILGIAWHSERCCAILHALPSVARYCVQHRAHIMQHFTACTDSGNKYYKSFGKFHRTERDARGHVLPAVIYENGDKCWCQNGKVHREDCDAHGRVLPAVIRANGFKAWYLHGQCHRADRDEFFQFLPAIITANGYKAWYRYGKRHSQDRDNRLGFYLPPYIQ